MTVTELRSEPFDPRKVSPSRVGTYADCGQAFKFKYLDRVTPERHGSAALFGKVMHRARETWVLDRTKDLKQLVREAWIWETKDDPIVASFLREYTALSGKAIRQEEEIRREWAAQGRESKAPRMTAIWKKSDVGKAIAQLNAIWFERLAASKYEFSENDPLPGLYDESLVLAWKYGDKYKHLPNAYASEISFDFEWRGFQMIGFIDEIGPLVSPEGESLGTVFVDAKTYRREPDHQFKDWRQGAMYTLAGLHLAATGQLDFAITKPIWFQVDAMRLLVREHWQFDDGDFDRLERELNIYRRAIEHDIYIPASKTCKADYCDFAKQCAFHHGNAAKPVEIRVA